MRQMPDDVKPSENQPTNGYELKKLLGHDFMPDWFFNPFMFIDMNVAETQCQVEFYIGRRYWYSVEIILKHCVHLHKCILCESEREKEV